MRVGHEAVLLSLAVAAAAGAGIWALWLRRRPNGDPEALRRELVAARGRIIEGVVTDFRDGVVYYGWYWRGVDYESSQDLSAFSDRIPEPAQMLGPVSVKFLSEVPSNSVVMSENWSGFSSSGSRNQAQ